MLSLLGLPYEVLSNIVRNIDFDDVFNLALSCKELSFLIVEESICKSIIETKIKHSNEALSIMSAGSNESGKNARALRRAAKRRNALAAVRPFTIAIIGLCDTFVYHKGVLCYTLDDKVRILNLHRSWGHEVVISIPHLLARALPDLEDHSTGIFQILYYADKIISCIYVSSDSDSTAWLIAIHLRYGAILVTKELYSTEKIFVRHNQDVLYFGTNSHVAADGYKKWVVEGYSFKAKKWFDETIYLPDIVGSEIGSTVCFELHEEYFYAVSNQTSFEVEEIDWTSFYHCIRFPLDSPCSSLLEKTEDKDMWRRQHQEGPIDDRWGFLRLDTDEATGKLRIVESRKEWYQGASRSRRTYYTTDIIFPKFTHDDSEYSQPGQTITPGSSARASLVHAAAADSHETFDNSNLPDDPIVMLRKKDDHPHYLDAPPRDPHNTHPGNDGSSTPTYTITKTLIRTYHTSASTYLDLVDDPPTSGWGNIQRLRLRGASRRLGQPLRDSSTGLLRKWDDDLDTALKELYKEERVRFFPEEQERCSEIYSLMNPPSHLGNVSGVMDERSMIYITGALDKPKALVFIGFDAGIDLKGVKMWSAEGVGGRPNINDGAREWNDGVEMDGGGEGHGRACNEGEKMVSIDRKGKGKAVDNEGTSVQVSPRKADNDASGVADRRYASTKTGRKCNWAWKESAMYKDIGLGYNFGRLAVPKR